MEIPFSFSHEKFFFQKLLNNKTKSFITHIKIRNLGGEHEWTIKYKWSYKTNIGNKEKQEILKSDNI